MLLPTESTECRHKYPAHGDVGRYLNGCPGYANEHLIDQKGGYVSIEVSSLMTVPVPKGARR